jgi:PAS domain S-box-containing protein
MRFSTLQRHVAAANGDVRRQLQREAVDFLENAAVPLHWLDDEGRILWANRAELDLLGYTRDEYIGRHLADFYVDAGVVTDMLRRLARNETLRNYEAQLRCKDGSIRHVLVTSNVLWADGKFVHTRCFTRDITEFKATEDARHRDLTEHRQAQEALRLAHEELEARVADRTQQLNAALEDKERLLAGLQATKAELLGKIAEMERFENVVVGRELKMVKLERELGRTREEMAKLKIPDSVQR